MSQRIRATICLATALTLLAACSDDDAMRDIVKMPVSLILPAEGLETRALPGDPGSYEVFNKPEYLYLFVVIEKTDGKATVKSVEQRLTGNWEKEVIGSDSIYRYTGGIQVMLPSADRRRGEVYAAVSKTELTLNGSVSDEFASWAAAQTAVQNITLTLDNDDLNHLQDIYSSPYNLTVNVSGNEQYYATIEEVNSAVPHVDNLMLYHVAAKVDLVWNVADNVQSDIRLTAMTVNGLSTTGKLFRPNENSEPASTDTYIRTIPINIGNQWDGRAYFYGIPYSNGTNYPLSLTLTKKNATDETVTKEVSLNIPYQTSSTTPFTHWMRGDIRINSWD